jgi:chromosomal replication initiator protein
MTAAFDASRVWQQALAELQLQMRREDFQTWFRDAELTSFDGSTCLISANNPFTVEWLDSRCRGPVARAISGIVGSRVDVRFAVRPTMTAEDEPSALLLDAPQPAVRPRRKSAAEETPPTPRPARSTRFSFSNFVVGPSNRLAHAACAAVAEGGPLAPNPLFIYGPVGVGKTHLLHAIGHRAVQSDQRVAYASSETFTNEFIESVSRNRMDAFRKRFREVDILLIDDVHFLAGKEQTQEEFFHTFNEVVESGGQIVLTSDRPPHALAPLAERLQSRFSWGLIADIQEPELETRLAIIRAKLAERADTAIADEVLAFIAERVTGNGRVLEGALTRILAQAHVLGASVDIALARAALDSAFAAARPAVDPDEVIRTVCRATGVTRKVIEGKGRDRRSAAARQLAMYVLREATDLSLAEIGGLLGGRDHSTVLHGHGKVAAALETDAALCQTLAAIKSTLPQR